jgi:hypothetical protein
LAVRHPLPSWNTIDGDLRTRGREAMAMRKRRVVSPWRPWRGAGAPWGGCFRVDLNRRRVDPATFDSPDDRIVFSHQLAKTKRHRASAQVNIEDLGPFF